MSEPIREQLAKEIGKHYYLTRSAGNEASCMCRQWVESVQRKPYTTWAQHVADALVVELAFLSPVGETEAAKPPLDPMPFYGPQEGERWPSNSNGVSEFRPRRIFSQNPEDYR